MPGRVTEDGTLCIAPLFPSLKVEPRSRDREGAIPRIRVTLGRGPTPFFGCG